MVSDLHQGTRASDLLFCVRWKRKSANPSTKTQTMETSKTKKLPPNLMRTFSVLLDQIVDVTCPYTSADTLDALDSTPLDLACKKDRSGKT